MSDQRYRYHVEGFRPVNQDAFCISVRRWEVDTDKSWVLRKMNDPEPFFYDWVEVKPFDLYEPTVKLSGLHLRRLGGHDEGDLMEAIAALEKLAFAFDAVMT